MARLHLDDDGLGLIGIVNVVWANLGLLQVLILVFLTSPAGIFSNFVREMGRRSGAVAEADPGGRAGPQPAMRADPTRVADHERREHGQAFRV